MSVASTRTRPTRPPRVLRPDARRGAHGAGQLPPTEILPDALVTVDLTGHIVSADAAAERLIGLPASQLAGRPWHAIVVADTHAAVRRALIGALSRAPRGLGWARIPFHLRRGDGSPVLAEATVGTSVVDGASVYVALLRDVSHTHHTEQLLRVALAEATQQAADARRAAEVASVRARRDQWALDISAHIAAHQQDDALLPTLAEALVPTLGDWVAIDLVSEHNIFRRTAVVHHDPAKADAAAILQQVYAQHSAPPPWFRDLRKAGRPTLTIISPENALDQCYDAAHLAAVDALGSQAVLRVLIQAGERVFGALTFVHASDPCFYNPEHTQLARLIADRLALALENRHLYLQALAADRAKSAFLAVMSHELRTPLASILGYAELLEEPDLVGDLSPTAREFVEAIIANGNHLHEMLDHVLEAARRPLPTEDEPLHRTRVEPNHFLAGIAQTVSPAATQRGLTLEVEVDTPRARLTTDQPKLRQILLNLLSNAIKYTDTGTVRLTAARAADGWRFEVADSGIGIPPAALERVFDAFFQVEQPLTRKVGGVGLGLHIADRLTRRLGGHLSVESVLGQGSRFVVHLPIG